jgi:hypothetical protein
MDFTKKKEFLNSIIGVRSIEVWDERRMAEEEGIPFKEKENSFELRGIEGLSLEKVIEFLNEKVLLDNDGSFLELRI